jgi:hypothetical protein
MNIAKETVTPRKAMEWLKRNVNNRPLSKVQVDHYARAMAESQWKLNGDSIRFNGNGDLIDGQHRLHACVQAGKSFDSYIVRGLEHDAFDTIDQGTKRSIGDVFARQGFVHYKSLAAACRWLYIYRNGMLGRRKLRPDEANKIIAENPGLHDAMHIAVQLYADKRLLNPSSLAFLIYECGQVDPDKSLAFWTAVCVGEGLTKGEPAHQLQRRLIQNLSSVAKLHNNTVTALAIKAWNAHRTRKPLGVLKWMSEEPFPTIAY